MSHMEEVPYGRNVYGVLGLATAVNVGYAKLFSICCVGVVCIVICGVDNITLCLVGDPMCSLWCANSSVRFE